jgi:hypothetical protein
MKDGYGSIAGRHERPLMGTSGSSRCPHQVCRPVTDRSQPKAVACGNASEGCSWPIGGCRWLPKQVQDIKELLQEAPLQDQ